MPHGFNGKVLRVDLSSSKIEMEEPSEKHYRQYLGGSGFVGYYLLKELQPKTDPLGPENLLIFSAGVITGVPISGAGRNSVGAKSPLTGAFGQSDAGGYFGAELKRAGIDAIIVKGRAERPTYIWVQDGKVELRDASHLWGKTTGESQRLLQEELGDSGIRTAQIGPAGEKMVRFACVNNDISHIAGRTGMGAVMGSKNLKAVAARGHQTVSMAKPEAVKDLAKWMSDNATGLAGGLRLHGTAGGVAMYGKIGALPTRNWREDVFEGAMDIAGHTMTKKYLVARRSCYACAVRCKREVKVDEPYVVDPAYGGPEYESLAALGSNCGVGDLAAVLKACEICNSYGMDTISCGGVVSFAMECFEEGLLTLKDTDGIELRFGNAQALVAMVERIGRREGLGAVLGEGVARAAKTIGRGAEKYAYHIKGQEMPMHEPRFKHGLGMGYAVSPTGADHCHNIHDEMYSREGPPLEEVKSLGILEPLPPMDESAAKMRMLAYGQIQKHLCNCLVMCTFVPWGNPQIQQIVEGVTGWSTTGFELMKVGERALNMARLFNYREGFAVQDDCMPQRFFNPIPSGPLAGAVLNLAKFDQARLLYYRMMGWDEASGAPSESKLLELGLGWATQLLVR